MPAAPDLVQQPSTLWVPPRRGSYGPEIIDWAAGIGIQMDAEQRRDIDVLASFGPGGQWLALETAHLEPRQNGKTKSVELPIALADVFLFTHQPDRVMWTSHLMKTSRDTFARVMQLIEANPSLSRRVKEVVESKSEEAIYLHDGSSLEFVARTRGAGRGLGGKRIVFDEALFVSADAMAALIPTLSARGNPQINYLSSAGLDDSDQLRTLMARGRRLNDPSLIFIEYKAPGGWDRPGCAAAEKCSHEYGVVEGCSLDNEDHWRQANHAVGRGRIRVEFIRAERRSLPPLKFGVERCGWEVLGVDATGPIPPEDWDATAVDPGTFPVPTGAPVFFIDVAPSQRAATIAVAAYSADGIPHLELAGHQLGTDWVLARAVQLAEKHPDALWGGTTTGGIGVLEPKLRAAGIELELLTELDFGRACVHLQNLVAGRAFTHADDRLLTAALGGAAVRPIGDGLWVLTRKDQTIFVEMSPLYAQTGAAWLLELHRQDDYDLSDSFE